MNCNTFELLQIVRSVDIIFKFYFISDHFSIKIPNNFWFWVGWLSNSTFCLNTIIIYGPKYKNLKISMIDPLRFKWMTQGFNGTNVV